MNITVYRLISHFINILIVYCNNSSNSITCTIKSIDNKDITAQTPKPQIR